jgi:hypothetical protein
MFDDTVHIRLFFPACFQATFPSKHLSRQTPDFSDQRNHSLKICQDSASINVAKAEYCQALTELSQDDNG